MPHDPPAGRDFVESDVLNCGVQMFTSLVALGWLGAMEDPTLPEFRYASFMVRIWRQVNGEVKEMPAVGWVRSSIFRAASTGGSNTLDEVPDLIRRQVEAVAPG